MSKFKEPWKIAGVRGDQIVDESGDFRVGITLNTMGDPCTENAERIVACVNAMDGIDDPAAARVILDEPQMQYAADMLEALKRLVYLDEFQQNATLFRYLATDVKALIKKVEGGK